MRKGNNQANNRVTATPKDELTEADCEVILDKARGYAELVSNLGDALRAHDDERALSLARAVAGVKESA